MESLSSVSALPETSLVARFEPQVNIILSQLDSLNDDELIHLAVSARQMEIAAFRLRGACVAELRLRARRLAGGRGKRDLTGAGISSQLSRMARQGGISTSTLQTDAHIHEVFFSNETRLACETTLPREYYVTALTAPDPVYAINLAHQKTVEGSYNRNLFRNDVKLLKQSISQNSTSPLTKNIPSAPIKKISVTVHSVALHALTTLVKQHNQSAEVVVAEALLFYRQSIPNDQAHSHKTTSPTLTQPENSQSNIVQPFLFP